MNDTMDRELSARLDAEVRAFQIDIPRAELTSDGYDPFGWAARTLRHQEMPIEEILAILWADDPELVHRYVELHRERLEERLADQRQALARLERLLAETILERQGKVETRTRMAGVNQ